PGATGNVHFNMKVFLDDPNSLDERLVSEAYTGPALVPASPWLGRGAPIAPRIAVRNDSTSGFWVLDIAPGGTPATGATMPAPPPDSSGARALWLWVVQLRTPDGWTTRIIPATERLHVLTPRTGATPLDVRVMAVDRVGNVGSAARVVPTF
ncbi:MAG: hypothetical protein HOQ19_16435, partial [Gemmatimonadaceae bacterium]|nr:hypothetical protein [Gemmatimonadaceae bacterium]